jgi:hypothetical protein
MVFDLSNVKNIVTIAGWDVSKKRRAIMPRNISPNVMRDSNLFKEMAPHINSISHSRLLFELCKASEVTHVATERKDVNSAFTWAETPQGPDFWRDLYREHLGLEH